MELWDLILLNPILNFLIALSSGLFGSFGLAIIVLTVMVRLLMLPLNLKQLHASKAMSEKTRELQPKLEQLQKKYAKDKARLRQEVMKLYKEAGISPMGCLSSPMFLTMLLQFPIWIALYQSIIRALAVTPQDLLGLSQHLYSWSVVREALPISGKFLWLNLAYPDPYFLIPLLVMATMWVSQKMITPPALDPRQQSMNNMMQLMMPLMFGIICFSLPSGLSLYWVISSIFSIGVQYYVYGWGNLRAPSPAKPKEKVTKPQRKAEIASRGQIYNPKGVKHGGKRKDGRRSHPERSRTVGTDPGGSEDRGNKKR